MCHTHYIRTARLHMARLHMVLSHTHVDMTTGRGAASTYAGGRRGKERAARHERSSDWRRGAAGSPDPEPL